MIIIDFGIDFSLVYYGLMVSFSIFLLSMIYTSFLNEKQRFEEKQKEYEFNLKYYQELFAIRFFSNYIERKPDKIKLFLITYNFERQEISPKEMYSLFFGNEKNFNEKEKWIIFSNYVNNFCSYSINGSIYKEYTTFMQIDEAFYSTNKNALYSFFIELNNLFMDERFRNCLDDLEKYKHITNVKLRDTNDDEMKEVFLKLNLFHKEIDVLNKKYLKNDIIESNFKNTKINLQILESYFYKINNKTKYNKEFSAIVILLFILLPTLFMGLLQEYSLFFNITLSFLGLVMFFTNFKNENDKIEKEIDNMYILDINNEREKTNKD